jgi:hypothetical protein
MNGIRMTNSCISVQTAFAAAWFVTTRINKTMLSLNVQSRSRTGRKGAFGKYYMHIKPGEGTVVGKLKCSLQLSNPPIPSRPGMFPRKAFPSQSWRLSHLKVMPSDALFMGIWKTFATGI